MRRIVLASGNAGKAREFTRLLRPLVVESVPETVMLPPETGQTFAENAEIKARSTFMQLGGRLPVIADDSGLEVRALGGKPGIRSARYAGETATDGENVARLLRELAGRSDRSARFVCELVVVVPAYAGASPDEAPRLVRARGVLEGTIEVEPRGTDGFGYDPVFRPLGWWRTLAEVAPLDKDRVSHRGAAAHHLIQMLVDAGTFADGALIVDERGGADGGGGAVGEAP